MEFYSLKFVLFLLGTLMIYYLTGWKKPQGQRYVLLVMSLVFYLLCGWKNIVFILLSAAVTFIGARLLQKKDDAFKAKRKELDKEARKVLKESVQKKKRLILAGVLLVNLGVLAWLKYWNVLLGYFGKHMLGSLILPLGISYYTFQSIGYLLDVYNSKIKAETDAGKYLLFISWFPQLIQGPINRYDKLAIQLEQPHTFNMERMKRAFLRIGYGLLKKKAIADLLSGVVFGLFPNIDPSTPGALIVVGILAYSAMQYADFSGGIDLVMGVSELFGIEMMENFRQPYFATTLGDFWRRWHISLGAWMRDYIFYPFALTSPMQKLGKWAGKHMGRHYGRTLPACIANILVFLVVGLWHGAESHFLLWGLYNGLVIALSDLFSLQMEGLREKLHIRAESRGFHLFRILRTFLIVNIGWYFDIIENFSQIGWAFRNTLTSFGAGLLGTAWGYYHLPVEIIRYLLVFVSLVIVFVISVRKENGHDVRGEILELNGIGKTVLYAAVLLIILVSFTYATGAKGFMYANF